MNICKISSITPDGKPWGEAPNGPYYPFLVVFEDGVRGQANAKTNPPAYKVGDKVGYQISGQTPRGQNKLKIDRKADPAVCKDTTPATHPDLEAATPVSKPVGAREASFHGQGAQKPANVPESPAKSPPHDATICWAIGQAVQLSVHEQDFSNEFLGRRARQLLALHAAIKNPDQDDSSVPF